MIALDTNSETTSRASSAGVSGNDQCFSTVAVVRRA